MAQINLMIDHMMVPNPDVASEQENPILKGKSGEMMMVPFGPANAERLLHLELRALNPDNAIFILPIEYREAINMGTFPASLSALNPEYNQRFNKMVQ